LQRGSLVNTSATAQKFLADRQAQGRVLLYHLLEEHSWNRPNNLFLEYDGRSWTYKQFFDDVQRVGNWLLNGLGIQNGEMVALDGPNSAEYLLIWFALEGVGGGISFINSHLTGTPLTHSVKLCECRYLIAERSMDNLVGPHVDELSQGGVTTIYYDQGLLESFTDSTPLPEERRKDIDAMEIRHLIYTSGISPHGVNSGVVLTCYRHHRLTEGRHVRGRTTYKHSTKCS
jgi:acyl-CoA synthetase (AMP-forming)/AMP-acid ligase II